MEFFAPFHATQIALQDARGIRKLFMGLAPCPAELPDPLQNQYL